MARISALSPDSLIGVMNFNAGSPVEIGVFANVNCEATNIEALKAYEKHLDQPKFAQALACLREKCPERSDSGISLKRARDVIPEEKIQPSEEQADAFRMEDFIV